MRAKKGPPSRLARRQAALAKRYQAACALAESGAWADARRRYRRLSLAAREPSLQARIANDLAALAVADGDLDVGRKGVQDALCVDPACEPARANLALLQRGERAPPETSASRPIKVAVVSMLFNWPSTGGGTAYTYELALFLARAGYTQGFPRAVRDRA